MTDNQNRAARIDAALPAYFAAREDEPDGDQTDAVDMLTDLLHWVRVNGGDPEEVLQVSKMHFDAETAEET